MFDIATREKYRYPTSKGEITTEDLWQLPLSSKNGFDLDSVAKAINRELKATEEESFVEVRNNTARTTLTRKLNIVVQVIQTKQAEAELARTAAQRKAERDRLTEILHLRTQEDLMKLSPEELQRKIDALST